VRIPRLAGANRDFILNGSTRIYKLMADDFDPILAHGQTIVTANRDPDFQAAPQRLREDPLLVEFVRISERRSENGKYDGVCS
jgi:hypothetical protein